MTKFNLKEHIAKNKSTFFGSLNEGQFSWMTQDTDQQIGSQEGNTIPVYMFDNTGKYWFEREYEGYGVFGGKDYYELLDQMNGGTGDREEGIRKAFDPSAKGKTLFPALVVGASNFDYKTHDFTQEAEHDPNQSWLPYEEDEDDAYIGDDEDSDLELEEGEAAYEYEKGKEAGEAIEKKKMKKSELKAKIKEMILAEMNLDVTDETSGYDFLAELEGMLNEAEGLTPLQDYVYQYEIEISNEDFANKELKNIKKLNTPEDVYDYYAVYRGWEQDKDLKYDLKNIYNQVKKKFPSDDLTPLQRRAYSYTKERFGDEEAENSLDQIKTLKTGQEFADWVNQKVKAEDSLKEAKDKEVEDEVKDEVDVDIEGPETMDEPAGGINVTQNADADLTGTEKEVQDNLEAALEAAKKIGDEKLQKQIGNSLTFFTRQHVVKEGDVAEGKEMKEGIGGDEVEELAFALGYDSIHEFFRDNPGAVDVVMGWAQSIASRNQEWKEMMIAADLLEGKKENLNEVKFKIGDTLQTYGGGEEVKVLDIKPNLAAALADTKNPKAVKELEKDLRQDLIDREDRNKPFYLVTSESFPVNKYYVESELEGLINESMFPMLKKIIK